MTITNNTISTGTLLHTATVNEAAKANSIFALFIMQIIIKHRNRDWGDCCEEDWNLNDTALREKGRILSSYNLPQDLKSIHPPNEKVWIITEWDRSYTTILFPSEY
jgi:hypothetical protein